MHLGSSGSPHTGTAGSTGQARQAALRACSIAVLEPLERRLFLDSAYANIAGTWHAKETVTYTLRTNGKPETGKESGSDDVTIYQKGNKVWYKRHWSVMGSSGTVTRSGTIKGNHVTLTGPFVIVAQGVKVATNTCTLQGNLVGDTLRLTGSGHASGTADGNSFTCDGKAIGVLKRGPLFTWSMPERYGIRSKLSGLIELRNSYDYVNPRGYTLNLDASASSRNVPSKNVLWTVRGNGLRKPRTARGKRVSINDLPQGTYAVTVRITMKDGVKTSSPTKVWLRDILIVAIGDSYSSGEGNPERAKGFFSSALWANGVTDAMARENAEAHRSTACASSLAALQIEKADPHSSVTFVLLSQSGATVDSGVLGPKGGSESSSYTLSGQIDELRRIVGQRKIDILTVSVGGNDIGFADRVADLVKGPLLQSQEQELADIQAKLTPALADLPRRYANLARALGTFRVGRTIVTEYPDPTRDDSGEFAEFAGDYWWPLKIDRTEAEFAYRNALLPLNSAVAKAASDYGWRLATDIADDFTFHGYAAADHWFVTNTEACALQGGGILGISSGSLHPNAMGHHAIAGIVVEIMRAELAKVPAPSSS